MCELRGITLQLGKLSSTLVMIDRIFSLGKPRVYFTWKSLTFCPVYLAKVKALYLRKISGSFQLGRFTSFWKGSLEIDIFAVYGEDFWFTLFLFYKNHFYKNVEAAICSQI